VSLKKEIKVEIAVPKPLGQFSALYFPYSKAELRLSMAAVM
jgi:hypothetical protein